MFRTSIDPLTLMKFDQQLQLLVRLSAPIRLEYFAIVGVALLQ